MAKDKLPFEDGWIRFTSAHKELEGKGLVLHAQDIFAVHEGSEPGTMIIEFDPTLDRASEWVFKNFDDFVERYMPHHDLRGRRPRKKKPAQEAGSNVVAFKRS